MTLLQAFTMQFILFMFFIIVLTTGMHARGQTLDDMWPDKFSKRFMPIFFVVFWLGVGTWWRYTMDWPLMGIWEKLLGG